MPFPLGWQAFYMACLQPLSSGEGTKTATGIASPFWPPESPGVLRSWGFGSQRALTSHLWVPSVGRALQGWAQVSRVSPPCPLSSPSSAFPGQGAQGSLGMTCCRRNGGQGASLPGEALLHPSCHSSSFPLPRKESGFQIRPKELNKANVT